MSFPRSIPKTGGSGAGARCQDTRSNAAPLGGEAKRTITFTASDESVDRYGDVLRIRGWKFDNYMKNPVVLWAHKSSEPPVGKCVEIHVESNPPALVQTVEFADHPFAETVRKLYADKFLRAVSVGFMPLEPPNRITDLRGNSTGGYEYTSMDLLELSCMPIPANPSAIARCVEKGFAEADLQRVFVAPSAEDAYKELVAINQEVASIAIAIATKAVRELREACTLLKAAGVRPEANDLTLAELLDTVKQAGANGSKSSESETVTTLDGLAAAVGSPDGIKEFERAVGVESESETFSTSRKWRDPGRLRKERARPESR